MSECGQRTIPEKPLTFTWSDANTSDDLTR